MNDTDANSGVETSFERSRLFIGLGWVAKFAGLALVLFYFWAGMLLFSISWVLDALVHPARPAPDPRDRRLKWALLGFLGLFFVGWIVQMVRLGGSGLNPVMVTGLIGLVICEFSRFLRADWEYLSARRRVGTEEDKVDLPEVLATAESAEPVAPAPTAPQPSSEPAVVQGELPL